MNVDDEELRALVRDAIRRHVDRGALATPTAGMAPGAGGHRHAAYLRLPLPRGEDGDGACLVEPVARCSRCGFCQSYGH